MEKDESATKRNKLKQNKDSETDMSNGDIVQKRRGRKGRTAKQKRKRKKIQRGN